MSLVSRVLIFCPFIAVAVLSAQTASFPFSGTITDSSNLPVSGANIQLYSRDANASFSTVSDDRGNFRVVVPTGDYLLEAHSRQLILPDSPIEISIIGALERNLRLSIAKVSTAIQVTAVGTPQTLDETAKAVSIVDRTQIDQRGVETAIDALRQTPGLRIAQRGGPGTFASIQVRGLRTFDTSVLIDGMRFRDVGATQADASSFLSDLLIVDTDRIEVLRGSGSSLYGTNAIGGVVNILTDTGTGLFHGTVTLDGGGLGEFRGLARFGAGAFHDRFHYSTGIGHQNVTDGVASHGRYRNTTGNGLVDYSFRPGLTVSGRLLATDVWGQLNNTPTSVASSFLPRTGRIAAIPLSNSQIQLAEAGKPYTPGTATFVPELTNGDYSRTAQFISSLVALQHRVSEPFSYRISYQAMLSNRNIVDGPAGVGFQPLYRTSSQFNGRIDTLQARANYLAGPHNLLTGGYELEREYFDSPSFDNNPNPLQRVNSRSQVSETSHSMDAQDQFRLLRDRLLISASGRYQHFQLKQPIFSGTVPVYAGATATSPPSAYTGDLSVAYLLHSTGTKIRSHAGNSYRKPSLYELFGTSFFGSSFSAYGDPRLRPERSVSIDGGIDQYFASDRVRVSGTYFYTRLQQVISFDFSGLINTATDPFRRSSGYYNTGGGIARGVELSTEAKLFRSTRVQSSYTYTNARDRVSQFSDGTLQTPRIFPHAFQLLVLQQFGRRVDATVDYTATSNYLYPFSRRPFDFPGQRQVGLSAGYTHPFTDRLQVRFYTRITNLNDQTYFEDGFRTPGRWAVAGTTVNF